jgi:serine/threonine-protein kinase
MLTSGTPLGGYDIVGPIGAGGMGEVYRARDTKLGRDVAIKILSDGFGHDPERVARFQREAQLLAALNHPHIATIHGFEEANGTQFLVLELVEGETLAERLKSGPIPVPEAVTISRQVADALQAAHEKGIIHRDLKPANIAFTADGQVKVLDFGLAKAVEAQPAGDVSNSPTMTLGATQAGVILGTAAYMAPEQAKGRPADKRSDVWAFGCVLYEMLTGKRAFEGQDVSDTLAAVLRGEPDWSALPESVLAPVKTLVRRCLQKDRGQRIPDLSTAHFLLVEAPAWTAGAFQTPTAARPRLWRRAVLPFGMMVLGAVAVGAIWFVTRPEPPRIARFQISPPSEAALSVRTTPIRDIAITPDGNRIIYTGPNDTLFVRALDNVEPRSLGAGGRMVGPFVSPDGLWVGFSGQGGTAGAVLQKIALTGGPPIPIVRLDNALSGATWSSDGTIVFATASLETGLQRIAADGSEGEPTILTRPNRTAEEADHVFPEMLPDGQAVLFTIRSTTASLDDARIAVLDLRTGTQTTLIRGGTDAHYVPSGHLIYGAAGTLRGVAFDLSRLAVIGAPVPVVPEVISKGSGGIDAAVAVDGTLVYAPGRVSIVRRALVWVDRQGRVEPTKVAAGLYDDVRLSPDGTRVALSESSEQRDIWVWELATGIRTRVTTDPIADQYPVWTPDGDRVLFSSGRTGVAVPNIFWRAADGTGAIERLTQSASGQNPTGIARDGTVVFDETGAGRFDIFTLTSKDRRVQPLVASAFIERNADISPNGRWLAYESNESGQLEIHVRPFPDVDRSRFTVSTAGGTRPLWARNGEELFYIAPDGALMAVGVEPGPTWKTGQPVKLFDWPIPPTISRSYDVSNDGRRFLALRPASVPGPASVDGSEADEPSSLVVVQHFDEELKQLVPTN